MVVESGQSGWKETALRWPERGEKEMVPLPLFPNRAARPGGLGIRSSEHMTEISAFQRRAVFASGRWIGADRGKTILMSYIANDETLGADCRNRRKQEILDEL
jgi:hypothetical protein